jgi:hypothetical protein
LRVGLLPEQEHSTEDTIQLWQKFSFNIVGRLPVAFKQPGRGNVDALAMYKWLAHDAQ